MKKIFIAALVFFAFSQMEAQVTFRPGIRAGVNFSHFTQGDDYQEFYDQNTNQYRRSAIDYTSKTDFYVGLYGALKLTKFYTLQPEVSYSRQGSKVEYLNPVTRQKEKDQLDVSYVSVGVINKFSFEDFNIHIGPSIDVMTDRTRNDYFLDQPNDYYYYYDNDYSVESEIDLAFTFGIGYNFTKSLGIEARIKKGIIPVTDVFDSNHTNVVFSGGLTYTFNMK